MVPTNRASNTEGGQAGINAFSSERDPEAERDLARHPTTAARRHRAAARDKEFESPTLPQSPANFITPHNTVGPMSLSIALSLQAIFLEIVHKIEIYQDFDKKCGYKLCCPTLLNRLGFPRSRSDFETSEFWFLPRPRSHRHVPTRSCNHKALRRVYYADFVWSQLYGFYQQEIEKASMRVEEEYGRLKHLSTQHEQCFPRLLKKSAEDVIRVRAELSRNDRSVRFVDSQLRARRQRIHSEYSILHEVLRTQQIEHQKAIEVMKNKLAEWLVVTRDLVEESLFEGTQPKSTGPDQWPDPYSLLKLSEFPHMDDALLSSVSQKLDMMRVGDNFKRID